MDKFGYRASSGRRLRAVKRAMPNRLLASGVPGGYLENRRRASALPARRLPAEIKPHDVVKLKQDHVKLSAVIQKQLTGCTVLFGEEPFGRFPIKRHTWPARDIGDRFRTKRGFRLAPEMPPHPNP